MSLHTHPPLRLIAKTDFLAMFGAFAPPFGIAFSVLGWAGILPERHRLLTDGTFSTMDFSTSFSVELAIGFTLFGVALFGWRVWRIRSAFASGHRVPGTITRLTPFRGRAYLHYEYRVESQAIAAIHFVLETDRFKHLVEGQEVRVAVDPRRPRAGFVVELFEQ
jgi:hypothetical protein